MNEEKKFRLTLRSDGKFGLSMKFFNIVVSAKGKIESQLIGRSRSSAIKMYLSNMLEMISLP